MKKGTKFTIGKDGEDVYTAKSFYGKTGVEYGTPIEAMDENPGTPYTKICVKNEEYGGATFVIDCYEI